VSAENRSDSVRAKNENAIEESELEVEKNAFPIDRYKPLEILGSGGGGMVFLARDRLLKKLVAIKVLRAQEADEVVAFQKEAKATSKLKHRNIVEVLDFGVTPGGAPYMVLEYVTGSNLGEILDNVTSLDDTDFYVVFKSVCDALSYAHKNGVFHRDLKPANIVLTSTANGDFNVKLIDFGLARVIQEGLPDETKGLRLAGTPLYMSPDQVQNRPYDKRSEVYSLGCVMFEALTGHPPFQADTALQVLNMHAENEPPSLADFGVFERTEFYRDLEDVIGKCLQKEPLKRYQSVDEVKEALERLETGAVETKPGAAFDTAPVKRTPFLTIGIALIVLTLGMVSWMVASRPKPLPPVARVKRERLEFQEFAKPKSLTSLKGKTTVRLSAMLPDEDLRPISQYPDIRVLDISNNTFSDVATSYIHCPRLRKLDLSNNAVVTLEHVSKMRSLEELYVNGTNIDDAAIERISKLPNLLYLDVHNTPLTDKSVDSFAKMPYLLAMICRNTRMTPAGIERMRKLMPACMINDVKPQVVPLHSIGRLDGREAAGFTKRLRSDVELLKRTIGPDAALTGRYLVALSMAEEKLKHQKEAKELALKGLQIAEKRDSILTEILALRILVRNCDNQKSRADWEKYMKQLRATILRYDDRSAEPAVLTKALEKAGVN